MINLKVTTIQSDLHWENVNANLNMFAEKIALITDETDIIVLPEMFNTGFSMNSEKLAEAMDGKTIVWMKAQAKKSNAVIVGSLIVKENKNYYNRLVWVLPDAEILTYDKRHLFRMAGEHNYFTAGTERIIIEYKGWRICPLICYDLRFPVWTRNVSDNQNPAYDCLIYIANWLAARKAPWNKLLEARAIENQCYVVGVNRIGVDGTEKPYCGNSVVINPKGEPILTIPENENYIATTNLSLDQLNDFRKVFPVGMDGDDFEIIL